MTELTRKPKSKGFWLTIPSGRVVHVLGDPNMSQATLNALAEMAEAAEQMAAAKAAQRREAND